MITSPVVASKWEGAVRTHVALGGKALGPLYMFSYLTFLQTQEATKLALDSSPDGLAAALLSYLV
jgi:hypothetical protein